MGLFGATAIIAAGNLQNNLSVLPQTEWDNVIPTQTTSSTTQKKGCPRTTFITLAQVTANFSIKLSVQNLSALISSNVYKENALYALVAYNLLLNGSNCNTPAGLWVAVGSYVVANGLATSLPKNHNSQMNVVLALWNNNFL